MPISRPLRLTLCGVLAAGALAAAPSMPPGGLPAALAQEDVAREARLLALDGKFDEVTRLLAQAPAEVQNDVELRLQLAENAQKFLKNKQGEDRRAGLRALREHFGKVVEVEPGRADAAAGAIEAAEELAQLDVAAKRPDAARANANWAVELGKRALAAEGALPETKAALGRAHGLRASLAKTVDGLDAAVADFRAGAELLASAAEGHAKAAAYRAAAAELRLKEANLVHDLIPLEEERRDEEALAGALELATAAAKEPTAGDDIYALHLRTLLLAHDWKLSELPAPFMQPLVPAYEDLPLLVGRGGNWKRGEATTEWDVVIERLFPGENAAVQILVTTRDAKTTKGGRQWAQLEDVVPTVFEGHKTGFSEIYETVEPVLLEKKKGPEVWYLEISGMHPTAKRPYRLAEWLWMTPKRKDVVFDVKVLDWRRPSDVREPDLVAFVGSAVGEGVWPDLVEEAQKGGRKKGRKK